MVKCFTVILLLFMQGICFAQRYQRVEGTVLDRESKTPLPGVTVAISDLKPPRGTATDTNGKFVIDSIPAGKHTVTCSYMGYEPVTVADVMVTSAKEVVLSLELEELVHTIKEVVVTQKREHINDMAVASVKTFDVQETGRYAGSRDDPARMASNFAGAQGGDDSRNDIVIRGNSPQGVLWRIEGIDVPNPDHFSIPGTTGGPVSMLNSKTLGNSDFFMGAFPAEYGNAVAGVFDLNLRNGNTDRYEATAQVGLLGTELAAEGPINAKDGSSFQFAYRYSTLQLFQTFNIQIGTTSVPFYQDATFKLNFPLGKKKRSDLAVFGIGGLSSINLVVDNLTSFTPQLYGEADANQYFKSNTGIVGVSYKYTINKNTYTKFTLAETGEYVWAFQQQVFRNSSFVVDSPLKPILGYDFTTLTTVAHWLLNTKLSPRQTLRFGVINNFYALNLVDSSRQYPVTRPDWQYRENYQGATDLMQAYAEYKYRPSERVTLLGGLHAQYLTLNGSESIEPRIGLRWNTGGGGAFTAGYGLHSQMQPLYEYFANLPGVPTNDLVNKNVGFTRSNHLVIGYDRPIARTIHLKMEAYCQYLFHVPVETTPGSSWSGLDQGSDYSRDFPDTLKNTGTGYNYGLELTVEKAFSDGYYVLFTGTVFDSKARGNDDVYRNTDFNSHYAFNLLGGYELKTGSYSTLVTGLKMTLIGGKLYSPVDIAASNALGDLEVVQNERNSLEFPAYFRTDLKLGYRINARKVTHEVGIDLVNVFNTQNVLSLSYSYTLEAQGNPFPFYKQYQLGFLPIFYYKIDFGLKKKRR